MSLSWPWWVVRAWIGQDVLAPAIRHAALAVTRHLERRGNMDRVALSSTSLR